MNGPEEIKRYREEERAAIAVFAQWAAQTIVTPLLLALILWRVW